jgi:cytochrome c-type biogenesis protein CcmH/NrfF
MRKRLLHIALLCVLAVPMLGAGAPSSRFDALGHKLVCQCGCGQILLECNHVGCPVSPVMIEELKAQLATGLPDSGVLNFFIGKYGPVSLAAPIRGGFDIVAWIVPFAVLLAGLASVGFVVRQWRRRQLLNEASAAHSQAPPVADSALRDQIRRDTTY